jgi:hypothetical protein
MSAPRDSPGESSLAEHLAGKERNRSLIVHPEAIHVLFELSKYADNEGMGFFKIYHILN